MRFCWQLFIHIGLHSLRHFQSSTKALLLWNSLQCIIYFFERSINAILLVNKLSECTYCMHYSHWHFISFYFCHKFPWSMEQTNIALCFTASVPIIPWICFPCSVLHIDEFNCFEKCWSPGSCWPDVNLLSNGSLPFLAFRYLSSQCNKSLTKLRSSWYNISGCQSRVALQTGYHHNWL